jgi:predicted KAP-like P-loop ATPase
MKVLTDEIEEEPVLGSKPYAECLVDIIRDTPPRFSIGIYGEWGTGKTTLMELIEDKLNRENSDILTVWFNAW